MTKRPFAVIGFSMLITFAVISNITHEMTIALLTGAIVVFAFMLAVRRFRRYRTPVLALAGVIAFTILFVSAEGNYLSELQEMKNKNEITGVVCETPKDTDYSATYVIKVDGERFKVRFSSTEDHFIEEGDRVRIRFSEVEELEADIMPTFLADKIYFMFFGGDECSIERTGEQNLYYKYIGAARRWFTEVVMTYLPGENGAIALAMVIGDKNYIEEKVTDWFNYSGVSHLLVISGLHLTVWSVGVMSFLDKFSKTRKYSHYIGLLTLIGYSAITGFTVSVIRAGMMVGTVLLGRAFRRDADSINSVGGAVALMLIENPFAPNSTAMWLSVLSTLGMLAFSGKVQSWLYRRSTGDEHRGFPLKETLFTTISISFSTAVFTLPVFVFRIKMLPVASVLANFIMVTVAMVLMISSVAGAAAHLLFLYPVARLCYFITGICGRILYYTSEKIAMSDWSTISVDHSYYKAFFVILIAGIVIMLLFRKRNIDILKPMTLALAVVFAITSVYCTKYEHRTPSVELLITDSAPVAVVTAGGETTLVGLQSKAYDNSVKEMLNRHNEKRLDNIYVLKNSSKMIAETAYLQYMFGGENLYFYDESPAFYGEAYSDNVESILVSGTVRIKAHDTDCIEISTAERCALIADYKNIETVYENAKKYDIIIFYGRYRDDYEAILDRVGRETQLVRTYDGMQLSFYLE